MTIPMITDSDINRISIIMNSLFRGCQHGTFVLLVKILHSQSSPKRAGGGGGGGGKGATRSLPGGQGISAN